MPFGRVEADAELDRRPRDPIDDPGHLREPIRDQQFGGQSTPGRHGRQPTIGVPSLRPRREQVGAEPVPGQGIEVGGELVDHVVGGAREVQPESLGQHLPDRVDGGLAQPVERQHVVGRRVVERFGDEQLDGGRSRAVPVRACPGQPVGVEAPRPAGGRSRRLAEADGPEVAGVEAVAGVIDPEDRTEMITPAVARVGEHVVQLVEDDRGRDREVCPDVDRVVGDHQRVLRGHDRVEQELTDLRAWVPVTDPRRQGEEVVASGEAAG